MQKKLFGPLGMTRTTVSRDVHESDSNVATPYLTLLDGSQFQVPPPDISDKMIDGPAGGIRSSISDMLKWCAALLEALKFEAGVSAHLEALKIESEVDSHLETSKIESGASTHASNLKVPLN